MPRLPNPFRTLRPASMLALLLLCVAPPRLCAQDVPAVMGGGNFTNGRTDAGVVSQLQALQAVGVRMARFNLYPDYYYPHDAPNPTVLDGAMDLAYQYGITPMLLFEHHGGEDGPVGGYDKWYAIGQAFAQRFRPNGEWAVSRGIANWGITIYTAINEPDNSRTIPTTDYATALEGLADGVHAVDPTLRVNPGGFMSANARSDYTLAGYGPALAALYNGGKLDGLDLHTYYSSYAPIQGSYRYSAQSNFASVKQASGITADISFYATEFNYNRTGLTDEQTAAFLLTGIWDNLGVTRNDGATGAMQFAFLWNLFHCDDAAYGLCTASSPWTPSAAGAVVQRVAQLTAGLQFVSRDPWGRGEYQLAGPGKTLWVWQDRPHWSTIVGTSYTVNGLAPGARSLQVHGWDGLRSEITLNGETSYTVTGLPGNETYMFLVTY